MDYLNKKTILVIMGILILAAVSFNVGELFDNNSIVNSLHDYNTVTTETDFSAQETTEIVEKQSESSNSISMIYVDIDGAINSPGVYTVNEGTRLYELIQVAGGLTENAETKNINRADLVYDKQKVYIPEINEQFSLSESLNQSAPDSTTNKININNASIIELDSLPGIGEAIAQRIIDYRIIKKFDSIDEIMNVSGIAEIKYEQIKNLISIN